MKLILSSVAIPLALVLMCCVVEGHKQGGKSQKIQVRHRGKLFKSHKASSKDCSESSDSSDSSAEDPCSTFECLNGGTCITNTVDNSPECQCTEGYGGDHCEIEACSKCPEGFSEAENGNCYLHPLIGKTAEEARTNCQSFGAELWEPKTQAEVAMVLGVLGLGVTTLWTGASEEQFGGSEGNALFPNGNALPGYADVDSFGECANNAADNCVAIFTDPSSITWCFLPCSTSIQEYVCEVESQTCPV